MPNDGKIHFYFDFLSPFGYFGSLRVNELAMRHKMVQNGTPSFWAYRFESYGFASYCRTTIKRELIFEKTRSALRPSP